MAEYIERVKAQDGLDNIDWYHVNDKGRLVPGGESDIEIYVPFKAVEDMLKSIPAADVRPVVRGRWEWDVLDGTPGYRPVVLCCSNCHRVSFSGWDFCPNCGADMREES